MELYASYVYMSMAAYFDRDDVALQGFAKRFRENSDEEREHAQKLINYQNMRGGRVVFQNVTKPNTDDWTSALSAVEASLELEKSVHESILAMHKNADEQGDAQLTDFLEGEYLKEQVEAQKRNRRPHHKNEACWRLSRSSHHRQGVAIKTTTNNLVILR